MRYYDLKGNKIVAEIEHQRVVAKLETLRNKVISEHGSETTDPKTFATRHARILRAFDNGKFRCEVEWVGCVSEEQQRTLFVSDYPLYKLIITDYLNGKLRNEPTDVHHFNKLAKALVHYEDMVISYSNDAYYDEEGTFVVERNNIVEHALPLIYENQEDQEDNTPKVKEAKPQTEIAEDSELFGW